MSGLRRHVLEIRSFRPLVSIIDPFSISVRNMGGPGGKKRPVLNWKQRKQLGIGKEYVDVSEVLRKEQYNLQTREQFKEFAKNSDTTFIEIGQGDFEMPEEMLGEIMDAGNTKKVLQPSMLFGSHKNRGFLYPRRTNDRKKIKHMEWLAKNKYGYV